MSDAEESTTGWIVLAVLLVGALVAGVILLLGS
jgi:hypothetical protein